MQNSGVNLKNQSQRGNAATKLNFNGYSRLKEALLRPG
jgi:hypothetical protein